MWLIPTCNQMATKFFECQGIWAFNHGSMLKLNPQWQLKAIEFGLGPFLGLWGCVGPL